MCSRFETLKADGYISTVCAIVWALALGAIFFLLRCADPKISTDFLIAWTGFGAMIGYIVGFWGTLIALLFVQGAHCGEGG